MSDHPSDTNAREYGPGKAAVCDERCPITKHDCEHRPPYPEWGGCRTFREHNADTRLEAQATRPLPDDVKAAVDGVQEAMDEVLTLLAPMLTDRLGKALNRLCEANDASAAALTAAQAEIAERDALLEAERNRSLRLLSLEADVSDHCTNCAYECAGSGTAFDEGEFGGWQCWLHDHYVSVLAALTADKEGAE